MFSRYVIDNSIVMIYKIKYSIMCTYVCTNFPLPFQLATHATTAGHPDACTNPQII